MLIKKFAFTFLNHVKHSTYIHALKFQYWQKELRNFFCLNYLSDRYKSITSFVLLRCIIPSIYKIKTLCTAKETTLLLLLPNFLQLKSDQSQTHVVCSMVTKYIQSPIAVFGVIASIYSIYNTVRFKCAIIISLFKLQ